MKRIPLPDGWMGKKCRKFLRAQARAVPPRGVAVEVGSWRGRSTLVLADALARKSTLYAVDTWAGTPDDPEQHDRLYADAGDVFADFKKNLAKHITGGRVVPLRTHSLDGAARIQKLHGPESLDLVFIDADHRYEAVSADIEAYLPLVKPAGMICGHDAHWASVDRAVTEKLPDAVRGPGSIWQYRKAA